MLVLHVSIMKSSFAEYTVSRVTMYSDRGVCVGRGDSCHVRWSKKTTRDWCQQAKAANNPELILLVLQKQQTICL